MKTKSQIVLTFLIITLFNIKILAQHCPFDGASIVILNVLDKKNKTDFVLKEVDNPQADSCTYAEGLLQKSFQPIDSFYAENHWIKTYEKRYKMQKISSKGNLYVKLTQATADCMIKNGNNYDYIKRQFVITFKDKKTGETEQIDVPENRIFKMCTSAGSWDRIEAITVE